MSAVDTTNPAAPASTTECPIILTDRAAAEVKKIVAEQELDGD